MFPLIGYGTRFEQENGKFTLGGNLNLRDTELQGMNPEDESIKPDDEDEDGSNDIDTEDLDSDKTEGDELKQ